MKSAESVPCICEKGALQVEVAIFGTWTVETLVAPCPECHRADIGEARGVQQPLKAATRSPEGP